MWSACLPFGVPTGAGFRGCRTCQRLLWSSGPLVVCSLLLSALSLCPCWVVLEICLYSRFEGVFRGFPLLDVCLYCSRALRGLCGFCVREWLGGLEACCVFAPVFHLLPISFCLSFPSLVLLFCFRPALLLGFLPCLLSCALCCFLVLLPCLVCSCVFVAFVVVSFSLSVYTQKRAQFSCVLSCPVMCV